MTVDAALREEAEQHIRDHVEGERTRVERVGRPEQQLAQPSPTR
jgi:hypothetical protein